jgi:hypothetical protein
MGGGAPPPPRPPTPTPHGHEREAAVFNPPPFPALSPPRVRLPPPPLLLLLPPSPWLSGWKWMQWQCQVVVFTRSKGKPRMRRGPGC